MGVWGHRALVFFIFIFSLNDQAVAATKANPLRRNADDPQASTRLRARIQFPIEGEPVTQFASIAVEDPLVKCPLESLPQDLKDTVNALVDKIEHSVDAIRSAKGDRCAGLKDRLFEVRSQVADAIKYQALFGIVVDDPNQQDQINARVQQAGALNAVILTATSLLDYRCISSLNDKVVIQRLIGQVITLSGLFVGGWEGVGLAATGLLVSSVPIFRSQIERATELIQKYKEINKGESFLCFHRQMQRTSCLLFAQHENNIINGFDLTLQSGPPKQTLDRLEEFKKTPEGEHLLNDMKFLRNLTFTAEPFMSTAKSVVLADGSIQVFEEFKNWCFESEILKNSISDPTRHPAPVGEAIGNLKGACEQIAQFAWGNYVKTDQAFTDFLWSSYWKIGVVYEYYTRIKRSPDSEMEKVAKTWESSQYYDRLVQSVSSYRKMADGNQTRLNYLNLTEKIGDSLAKSIFHQLWKKDYRDLNINIPFRKRVRKTLQVRRRALTAMLDLCKTFDPTLACLYVDSPEESSFFKEWKDSCVGGYSQLCKSVSQSEYEILLPDLADRAYFDSLCGTVLVPGL